VSYLPNNAPTGTIESIAQKQDTSGTVDVTISVGDPDEDYARARIEYEAGTVCGYSSPAQATLDENDASATSTQEDVDIDNGSTYQIGTSTERIQTASGTNYVYFDWLSASDIDNQEGYYCLYLTVNDYEIDQAEIASTSIFIDNKAPDAPGALTETGTTTKDTVTLEFGATSSDANFVEYRIYYATSTPVTESDYVISSTTDLDLANIDFNDESTTSVTGLEENTTYYFTIWAYDSFGHVSSSSPTAITTNKTPEGFFTPGTPPVQKTDGSGIVDISIDVYDANPQTARARIDYKIGTSCDFSLPDDPTLDEGSIDGSIGAPTLNDLDTYQIGNILTTATNTITFDWTSVIDDPTASGTYCPQLTANDERDDQNFSDTATVTLDNVAPTPPGSLENGGVSSSSVTLLFGSSTVETNFQYYKIYYTEGISGVNEGHTPHVDSDLNYIDYNNTSSTTVTGLNPSTDYVFNIWAYDTFGNKASATAEFHVKTDALISNDSLTFIDPVVANYAIADGTSDWTFRAVVSDASGWTVLDTVKLRLADADDNVTPFTDLEFTWDQTSDGFSETGTDAASSTILLTGSSTCADTTCTLDFKLRFFYTFASSGVDYTAELYSTNDSAVSDEDSYANFYQIRIIQVRQIHYRWREDDGGE
jgi:hypothetical protein